MSSLHDECGIIGLFGPAQAAELACIGLAALQHRGQESAGIASLEDGALHAHRGLGLVNEVFAGDRLTTLPGSAAIGHVRYSTMGSPFLNNAQPTVVNSWRGPLAVAHNGNLVNAAALRRGLEREGAIFQSSTDSEVMVQLLAANRRQDVISALREMMTTIEGAYSLVMLTRDALVALRDPRGFRPLFLGRLEQSWVAASETCALEALNAIPVREIAPGEILVVSEDECRSFEFRPAKVRASFCIFEYIYFSRSDSCYHGKCLKDIRHAMGERLASEQPATADCVIAIPDSGADAAAGYAEAVGLPLVAGLVRNRQIGRTFIQPSPAVRDLDIRLKLTAMRELIRNRRVVIVDDSIVRGATMKYVAAIVREAGARETHVRIASPPIRHPCFYGIDIPCNDELIAATGTPHEIVRLLGVKTLGYLSLAGALDAIGCPAGQTCLACFTGDYPLSSAAMRSNRKEMFEQRPAFCDRFTA